MRRKSSQLLHSSRALESVPPWVATASITTLVCAQSPQGSSLPSLREMATSSTRYLVTNAATRHLHSLCSRVKLQLQKTFVVVKDKKNFSESVAHCKSLGGVVALPESSAENYHILDLIGKVATCSSPSQSSCLLIRKVRRASSNH